MARPSAVLIHLLAWLSCANGSPFGLVIGIRPTPPTLSVEATCLAKMTFPFSGNQNRTRKK